MKRILAILLCLALILCGATACKPDNITYPSEITDPDQKPSEDQPSAAKPQEEKEEEKEEKEEKEEEQPLAPVAPGEHPLSGKNYKPSTGTKPILPIGGFIKDTSAADALKDRTITFYTAREEAAFSYVNQKDKTINEWSWIKALAKEYGFTAQIHIKSADRSLKSQRVALLAGKDLSVLQLSKEDLAAGMTLARSAKDLLDRSIATYGISNAVLTQSNDTLFAPVGEIESLWYQKDLMPEGCDPLALSKENKWTIETFKTAYEHAATNGAKPLQMSNSLAWLTLSGKSPLTLAEGKLDQNLGAKDTQAALEKLREVTSALPTFLAAEGATHSFKEGNLAMAYTNHPEQAAKEHLGYAPLPSLEEGTVGTVTFGGTFMALPKYRADEEADRAALAFIEQWCNRYTEARAARLMNLGLSGEDYVNYISLAEQNGHLIFHNSEIESLAGPYLFGLWDKTLDMEKAYAEIKTDLSNLLTRFNLYY